MKGVAAAVSVMVHAAAAAALAGTRGTPPSAPQRERVQVEVQMTAAAPSLPPAPVPSPPPPPKRAVHPVRLAPAVVAAVSPPPSAEAAPPPPSAASRAEEPPVVIGGIAFESTSASGSFAVAAGNTLYAAPDRVARDPAAARPYKAARFAPASELAEAPRVLNRDEVEIRRYYPKEALQRGREGEVVMRLVIDSDGSIIEASVLRDPGNGMGAAALRAVREFRFAPGRVGTTPVATAIPFVIRFVIS